MDALAGHLLSLLRHVQFAAAIARRAHHSAGQHMPGDLIQRRRQAQHILCPPAAPASSSWSLVVEDQGSGSTNQPRSANGKHGGTGLGLDIVRRTAALAGGVAEIGRGTNGGYRVEVRLPLRTPEP